MTGTSYERVCYRTEQREDHVPLRNIRNGAEGVSFGCTLAGETVQVKLANGELDSWGKEECTEVLPEPY